MIVNNASTDVAVVVPAAGSGSRLGGRRKQFRHLGGAPLLVQTLRCFERHPEVEAIVVAGPPDDAGGEELAAELRDAGISKLHTVVRGGSTRQESVRQGVDATPTSASILLIHDAVRPFVSADELSAVIAAVRHHGAAALASPATDTMRHGTTDGFFDTTVDRSTLFHVQTPQGFRREWIVDAFAQADRAGWDVTDDVELVMRTGRRVAIVEGSSRNIKITTPADWDLAEQLWYSWAEPTS